MRKTLLLMLLTLFLFPALSAAQTCAGDATTLVRDPTTFCFEASADHDATDLGQPVVTGYRLLYFADGVDPATGSPLNGTGLDLGKPTPVGPNKIIQGSPVNLLASVPIGMIVRASVVAYGPTGSGRSALGNPFGKSRQTPPSPPVKAPIISRP
jgi:hypothetical protein